MKASAFLFSGFFALTMTVSSPVFAMGKAPTPPPAPPVVQSPDPVQATPPPVTQAPPAPPLPTDPVPPTPSTPQLPAVEVTTQGAVFTRVDGYPTMTEVYKDNSGYTWAVSLTLGLQTYNNASQYCDSHGLRLPTADEIAELREKDGLRKSCGLR